MKKAIIGKSVILWALCEDDAEFFSHWYNQQEGIQEQGYYYNGEFSDFVMMRILKSDYNITN